MSRIFFIAALSLAVVIGAQAQAVKVEVVTPQNRFLPREALVVGVRITNLSGQPLRFGQDDEWLKFNILTRENLGVPKLGEEVPVRGEFVAPQAARTTARFDLAPYFDLLQPGQYTVTAVVQVRELGETCSSLPAKIEITKGMELWEQEFGKPPAPDSPGTAIRRYALLQANNLGQLKLYVRVSESQGGQILKVFPLGVLVGSSRPEHQIDRSSNLHVLHQYGARAYGYCMINPDGDLLVRQTFDSLPGLRARLGMDQDGKIIVTGGERRAIASDIPPAPISAEGGKAEPSKPD